MAQEVEFFEDGTAMIKLPNGTEFRLQQVSAMSLYAIQSSQLDKPKPPFAEITNRKGKKRRERNPDDPTYQDELATWTNQRQSKLMQYIIANGVTNEIPNGFEEYAEGYVDINNEDALKFFWVSEQLDIEDLETLSDAIIEMAQPSEEGIKDAEETFQSDGESS